MFLETEKEVRQVILTLVATMVAFEGYLAMAALLFMLLMPWGGAIRVMKWCCEPMVDWATRKVESREERKRKQWRNEIEREKVLV